MENGQGTEENNQGKINNIKDPYIQYMYSYPHKTAYRSLSGINLGDEFLKLKGCKNSLYFHIPFCQYKCGYCNLFSVAGLESKVPFMEEYIYTMEKQAGQIADVMPDGVSFSDMAIGGGTPLLLPEHLLERVFVIARNYFGIKNGAVPVAVETSPNQTTESKLELLKDNGVTRISIGVQSFNNIELKKLHRFHSPERAIEALEAIKNTGFECLNIDIIYGIPGQTEDTLLKSLKQAVSFAPGELFVYPLYVKKGTYLYEKGIERSLNAMELYKTARSFLLSHGYLQVSMRRFVKNNNYLSNSSLCGFGNTISVGCGGRSYIGNLHYCTPYTTDSKGCMDRLSAYIKQKNFLTAGHGYILPEDEQKRRYAARHILFGNGILREDYRKHFGKEAEEDFPVIMEWVNKGYAYINKGFITLTETGLALSDYLGPYFISREVRSRMDSFSQDEGGNNV